MRADDENPKARWESISDWYLEFATNQGWEFTRPMAELTTWVAHQEWAASVFPFTSHESLCVKVKPGYDPDTPFFSCQPRRDGQFEFELWAAVGRSLERRVFPVSEVQSAFANFVRRLENIA